VCVRACLRVCVHEDRCIAIKALPAGSFLVRMCVMCLQVFERRKDLAISLFSGVLLEGSGEGVHASLTKRMID